MRYVIVESKYMRVALQEARKAYRKKEVPIGCVIVKDGKIVAKAHNLREKKNSATAHAEILAINKACKKLKSWRLVDCDMYVTLEPCIMCGGAIYQARISNLIYGAGDNKNGAFSGAINLENIKLNHTIDVTKDIYKEESEELIKKFFKKIRLKRTKA